MPAASKLIGCFGLFPHQRIRKRCEAQKKLILAKFREDDTFTLPEPATMNEPNPSLVVTHRMMRNDRHQSSAAMEESRLFTELRRLEWAHQLPEEVLQDIAASAELVQFETGQIVIELDSAMTHVHFVVTGRLTGSLFDRLGKEVNREIFGRGSVVGLLSVPLPDLSHLSVEAIEQTTVIRLTLEELLRLTARHREFQLAMFRAVANIVKKLVLVERDLPKPAVVGVVHHSDATRQFALQIVRRLQQIGELPCMASDDEHWKPDEGIPYRLLYENGVFIGREEVKQILKGWAAHRRLFVDVRADRAVDHLDRLLSYSDVVLWCLQPSDVPAAVRTLSALERSSTHSREKVCLVWLLNPHAPTPPYVPELHELVARDFKICSGQLRPNQGELLRQGIERVVHYLRGVQIGLALGGGAARGMAHLGVLKSLEQHGIYIDMLAGTSAGALTGAIYAAGIDLDYLTQCFKHDLLPPWVFRQLPSGGYWYLLYKYRRHQFEPMLRKHLDHLHMEQLVIPVNVIAVDLVEGIPLLRDTGDAADNVLESINLPPLSLPIVRHEQAIVDGGLLNNVPANTLVAKGCNFVIASSVAARLEKDFMGIRCKKALRPGRFAATLKVLMRQNMIQHHSMNAVGVEPADFVIAPDVTSFDISEFTRADEMAAIGESTTNESMSKLKTMLSRLDPRLFG
jgi:predicted acylesterase/phospholipase RssA/CRP-like cAMP-binding protein